MMKFTRPARELLESLPDDRRADVGNYAKTLALDEKARSIRKEHVFGAMMLADESHLPEVEEGDNDEG
jgi:hypothetical protein